MTSTVAGAGPDTEPAPVAKPSLDVRPGWTIARLAARWFFIAVMTAFAFHATLGSLVASTREGSLNGFVWLTPIAAVLAAVGVARRERVELPIHDHQTDVIVGGLGMIVAVMVQWVLLSRYAQTFHLLRIDLIAMWLFLVSASVLLFGLRPVIRFRWVWAIMLLSFPLAYHLSVIAFGGNQVAAGLASLVMAAAATAVSVGRNPGRALTGAVAAMAVGLVVLLVMARMTPNAPLLAFQMIPALTAIVFVGSVLFLQARWGMPKRFLKRRIEPIANSQVLVSVPVVLAVAVLLSLVRVPVVESPPVLMEGMTFGRPLAPPVGWHQTAQSEFPWARRLYGREATLIRQRFVADSGDPRWDKRSVPRTVVVDTTNTWRPFSLRVYPAEVLYDNSDSRVSTPRLIDLGHGITGSLVTVVDDKLLLTWNFLSWTWRNEDSAQRIMVEAVDNHEPNAPFPAPVGGLVSTLRTLIIVLFRGNTATWDQDPTFKDEGLLIEFSRALIEAQVRHAERGR